jgi:hypothetical protein
MQIKRCPLSAASPFVNAAAGLGLLFAAAACSRQDAAPPAAPETAAIPAGLELPAVWSTRPLESPVRDIALSRGTSAILAIAFERGGLEFYSMDGDRLGETARFRLKAIADGRSTTVQGTPVTVFPGLTEEGSLQGYVYSAGLMGPAQIDLPIDENRSVAGLCTGDAGGAGILRLAYWTVVNNRVLRTGLLREEDGELIWMEEASTETTFPVSACVFSEGTLVASEISASTAELTRGAYSALLSLSEAGGLQISTDFGATATPVGLRDGITVRVPQTLSAITASGTMQAGGYPGGVVVVAGETASGAHQAVFVDPSALTRPGG